MTDKCDPIRIQINQLEAKLRSTEKFVIEADPDPEGPRPKPVLNPEWRALDSRVRSSRASLKVCEESLLSNDPVPVTLTLTQFVCLDQNDDFSVIFGQNVSDDEPYGVIFAVDLGTVANIPAGAINSKATLVGPLSDVNEGTAYTSPPNTIWGLSGAPQKVSSADNLILLVAMLEWDDGSPDQARTVLGAAAEVSLFNNLSAFTAKQIPRQELVTRIINDMMGSMGAATVGVPGPDDNVGRIQELRFLQGDLDRIYRNLGPVGKSLTFEGDDAKYILEFSMFR